MLTVPPVSPYTSVENYLGLLPSYLFAGQSDVEIVADIITTSAPNARIVADCGSGPCRLESALPASVDEVLAIEPNTLLWRSGARCRYIPQDAVEFLISTSKSLDVITWMWSLNYVLLSFFESYDPMTGTISLKDWARGNSEATSTLKQMFLRQRDSVHVIVYFDDASVEQTFLTAIWERIAPYPFGSRAHTRKLLESVLKTLNGESGFHYEAHHMSGVALYGSPREAYEKIMKFHLRGRFADDTDTSVAVEQFISKYTGNSVVAVPAGAYIYVVSAHDIN